MSALEYPREWFRATTLTDAPMAKMFRKETKHRLYYDGNRFEEKRTQYSSWHPTREEAQAAIDARKALVEKRKSDERIKASAPELLKALETLLDASERHIFGDECLAERDAARAAIAKARGAA